MNSVVISSSARTAIGSFGRSLIDVPPSELGATAARAAIARADLEPDSVEQVVFGHVIHTAPEDMYLGRVVGMKAGVPKEAPASARGHAGRRLGVCSSSGEPPTDTPDGLHHRLRVGLPEFLP